MMMIITMKILTMVMIISIMKIMTTMTTERLGASRRKGGGRFCLGTCWTCSSRGEDNYDDGGDDNDYDGHEDDEDHNDKDSDNNCSGGDDTSRGVESIAWVWTALGRGLHVDYCCCRQVMIMVLEVMMVLMVVVMIVMIKFTIKNWKKLFY